MSQLRAIWPAVLLLALVVSAVIVGIAVIIPNPTHPAFAQSGGNGSINWLAAGALVLSVGSLGYAAKSLWRAERMPDTQR